MDVGLLLWWWVLPIVVVLALVCLLVGMLWRKPVRGAPVAHLDRMTTLPRFQAALRRYRLWSAAAIVVSLVAVTVAGVAASRPASIDANQSDDYKRDILLCLDVSGSMVPVDAEIVGLFRQLAGGLSGERIGMRIFDSTSVMAFPLTSDYDYIEAQLTRYEQAFSGTLSGAEQFDAFAGTGNGSGASLVGDGLASCALDFADIADSERPRSIIFATDNVVNGQQLFSLPQAGQLAVNNDVRVYAINPMDFGGADAAATELREVAEGTGGDYFALDFGQTVPTIINHINAVEAGYIQTPPQVQIVDRPGVLPGLLVCLVGAVLLIAWRARL